MKQSLPYSEIILSYQNTPKTKTFLIKGEGVEESIEGDSPQQLNQSSPDDENPLEKLPLNDTTNPATDSPVFTAPKDDTEYISPCMNNLNVSQVQVLSVPTSVTVQTPSSGQTLNSSNKHQKLKTDHHVTTIAIARDGKSQSATLNWKSPAVTSHMPDRSYQH